MYCIFYITLIFFIKNCSVVRGESKEIIFTDISIENKQLNTTVNGTNAESNSGSKRRFYYGIRRPDLRFKQTSYSIDTEDVQKVQEKKNEREYQKHVKKLRAVNGEMRHNILRQANLSAPLFYLNNPVESYNGKSVINLDDFKEILRSRVQRLDSDKSFKTEVIGSTKVTQKNQLKVTSTKSSRNIHNVAKTINKLSKATTSTTKEISTKKYQDKDIKKVSKTVNSRVTKIKPNVITTKENKKNLPVVITNKTLAGSKPINPIVKRSKIILASTVNLSTKVTSKLLRAITTYKIARSSSSGTPADAIYNSKGDTNNLLPKTNSIKSFTEVSITKETTTNEMRDTISTEIFSSLSETGRNSKEISNRKNNTMISNMSSNNNRDNKQITKHLVILKTDTPQEVRAENETKKRSNDKKAFFTKGSNEITDSRITKTQQDLLTLNNFDNTTDSDSTISDTVYTSGQDESVPITNKDIKKGPKRRTTVSTVRDVFQDYSWTEPSTSTTTRTLPTRLTRRTLGRPMVFLGGKKE